MRVLIITNMFPGRQDPSFGTFVADQVSSLKKFVSIRLVAKSRRSAVSYLPFYLRAAWASLLGNHDLVHAHYGFHSAVVPLLLKRKPVVVTFHGSDALVERNRNWLYGALQRWTISRSARIIAVSEEIRKNIAEDLGANLQKLCVVPCGTDTSAFEPRAKEPIRMSRGIALDAKVVLFLGRLASEKGVDLLKEVAKQLPQVQFLFIGGGPLRWEAKNCTFLGSRPHAEIPEWINACDILVLPSLSEGSPVSIGEALASGVPVVCTNVGGCSSMVAHGVTGLLIPPNDQKALADAVCRALFGTRFEMAKGRQLVIEEYSLDVISKRLYGVYLTLTKDTSPRNQ